MPRPRNEELYRRVTAAILRQLLKNGIAGTSYASVAKECDISRATVQDYYPRKTDMVGILSKTVNDIAMEATLPRCGNLAIDDTQLTKIAHLFLAGSAYFEFMQREQGRRTFFAEQLRDRDQTELLMFSVMDRSFGEIGRRDVIEDPAYRNDLVMSIGGFYELFYDHLKRNAYFEPIVYFGHMTRVWMRAAGFTGEQVSVVLEQCEAELENINAMVEDMELLFVQVIGAADATRE